MIDDGRQEQIGFDLEWAIKDYRNELVAFNMVLQALPERTDWMESLEEIERMNGGLLVKGFLAADKNYMQYPQVADALKKEEHQKFIRGLDIIVDQMNNYRSFSLREVKELLVVALKKTMEFNL